VHDVASGRNIFSDTDGQASDAFRHYIGGLRKYLPAAMPLLAPYVNSYRRLVPNSDAPINVHWGVDNRTTGLRVPISEPASRRVENRVAGADANPYLAIAASLACGYLGMIEKIEPSLPVEGSAYKLPVGLPRHLEDGLRRLDRAKPLKEILGTRFVKVLTAIKEAENEAYLQVISPWEREFLLLNV
jgi:glutamine synthetase